MGYDINLPEKAIENKLRKDYFQDYNAEDVLGDIDFAVGIPKDESRHFESEYILWAEAKKSNHHDIYESVVQLILTIGKARTFDHYLPPSFLGAFDAEKIVFVPYVSIMDIFYMNDFNWNVKPSDHKTKEFLFVLNTVREILEKDSYLFYYEKDDKILRKFIRQNFVIGKSKVSKVRINKNNFTHIYQKWLLDVKPTIGVDWEIAKKQGIIDADFYLADILSEHNITLREKLFVLLRKDHYELDRKWDESGLFDSKKADFSDSQKAHIQFWNRYDRPPKREYWDYIVDRRDLLVPQDVRERKGSFFTPAKWVELSQQYIAAELGENWQDEYYVWDCCAGTGNLLAGLTNKYNIYASTLDQADVQVMKQRIDAMNAAARDTSKGGANLLESHVFQFDFLNDPLLDVVDKEGNVIQKSKLPMSLQGIICDPEKRKRLVIYINPPYAEHGNRQQVTGTGINKTSVATKTKTYKDYQKEIGTATRELYTQFLVRIFKNIRSCIIANFSTLKGVQAFNFKKFRNVFTPQLKRLFLVPANTFDNVHGEFPIGFFIWNTSLYSKFNGIIADTYDHNGNFIGTKNIYSYDEDRLVIEWLRCFYDINNERIGYLRMKNTDIQNKSQIFVTSMPSVSDFREKTFTYITKYNIIPICIYCTIRYVVEGTWLNDRDQFLYPNDNWQKDLVFQTDCLIYILFNWQNRISSEHGINHWIPFTEEEVDAQEKFESHFMSDFISGQTHNKEDLFEAEFNSSTSNHLSFSTEAKQVMDSGRNLWHYYHQQPIAKERPNASFYDIRKYFQGVTVLANGSEKMNTDSDDQIYMALITELRKYMKALASKIAPKVYEYGFLKI